MSQKNKLTTTSATLREDTNVRPRRSVCTCRIQNEFLIWFDASFDKVKNEECMYTMSQLREVVSNITTFSDIDAFIDFISSVEDEKAYMSCSESLDQAPVPIVHNMAQVNAIDIFCGNTERHEQWTQKWPKVKGVFTDFRSIYEPLRKAVKDWNQNEIPISFVPSPIDVNTNPNLNEIDQSYMYTQILKEIILTIDFEKQHIDDFISYCRELFVDDENELKNINKLEQEYSSHVPIWWYTYQGFLYSMLNRDLRTMEVGFIIIIGFFIRDLHEQIVVLHREQYTGYGDFNPFVVYRGQGFSQVDFEQLLNVKGGLLSFNNFLSTSHDREVSFFYAESNQFNPDALGVLFQIAVDSTILSIPFADISNVTYYHEEKEVLFSMHSIFHIGNLRQTDGNDHFWQVDLSLTSDKDPKLHALTKQIREETFPHAKEWYRLGEFLINLGQSDQAQKVYEVMIDQTSDYCEKANIYHQFFVIKNNQGEYADAITFYEKSNKINQKTLFLIHSDLAASYNNIGVVYNSTSEYSKALLSYEKVLEIRKRIFPTSHPSLATSYNNIDLMNYTMEEYSKALLSHEKALETNQKSLPPNHPDLAMSYSNIAVVYGKMGEYSKVLLCYGKVYEINEKSLTPDHHHWGIFYINQGEILNKMGECSKALSSLEKAFEIFR